MLACPFGEAGARGAAEGGIGQRTPEGDGEPHDHGADPHGDDRPNTAAAVDPSTLRPVPDWSNSTGGVFVDVDLTQFNQSTARTRKPPRRIHREMWRELGAQSVRRPAPVERW
jgi:hypothetical protein